MNGEMVVPAAVVRSTPLSHAALVTYAFTALKSGTLHHEPVKFECLFVGAYKYLLVLPMYFSTHNKNTTWPELLHGTDSRFCPPPALLTDP